MFDINKFAAIKVKLASPEKIRQWSFGEVIKPETINYRSNKPEVDGLFCERIFGPAKDYECHCGKYKKIRFQGMICEKCGVEITTKSVRRDRMGHIELATPVAHIWYLRGVPSRIGLLLDIAPKQLEEVVYFISRIVLSPGNTTALKYAQVLDEKTSRFIFSDILKELLSTLDENSAEYGRASGLLNKLEPKASHNVFKEKLDSLKNKYGSNSYEYEKLSSINTLYEEGQSKETIEVFKEMFKTILENINSNVENYEQIVEDFNALPASSNPMSVNEKRILERTFKFKFKKLLEDVLKVLTANTVEYAIINTLYFAIAYFNVLLNFNEVVTNRQETFEFNEFASFICKHTGSKFGIGAEAIKTLLGEVDLKKLFETLQADLKESQGQKRIKLIKRIEVINAFLTSGNAPEWMILDVLPVIPPELRPMLQLDGGRFATSDLNDLYRRVINRNIRLKKLIEINAPEVILMNEKRMVQEAVDALIDNGRRSKSITGAGGRALKSLSHTLKGKNGRFRQNLLGKRVDYSGRSVIAVGPDLKMYQCGLPREMAVQLFKPFIAARMLKDGIASSHKNAEAMIERYDERIWDIIEDIIKEHPVLLNRAPTLHRLGIQAFEPKLVNGRAIRLHPLVTSAFNADFDGDQMAVHVPLSEESIAEARILMLGSNNIVGPKDGKPIVTPSQDMVLGNYYLTLEANRVEFDFRAKNCEFYGDKEGLENNLLFAENDGKIFSRVEDVEKAYQTEALSLHNRIGVYASSIGNTTFTEEQNKKVLLTTVGKVIFNQIFPSGFAYLNSAADIGLANTPDKYFYNKGVNLKEELKNVPLIKPFRNRDLESIINDLFKRFGTSITAEMLDKMKDLGFKYATKAGVTVSSSDISVTKTKQEYFDVAEREIDKIKKISDRGLLTETERVTKVVDIWTKVKDKVQQDVRKNFESNPRNPIYMMSDSGARGNTSHFTQLAGMRGLMANPSGETIELPIKSSFRDGLTVLEFFISTHGARKGQADTALKTADSGYLTRRLVDVAQDYIVREEDCNTDRGSIVTDISDKKSDTIIVPLYDRLVGRFAMRDVVSEDGEIFVRANEMIDEQIAKRIIDAKIKQVEIRTLFSCDTINGVCKKCYGRNLATGGEVEIGESVGVMAAQSIGEPGTQLTMRTFHTGGVAGGQDITQGLPRVEELFEARTPKGECIISEIEGRVASIEESDGKTSIKVENDREIKEYMTPFGVKIRVELNEEITAGEKLTDGAIDPKKLLEVSCIEEVQKYILKEVQKVYRMQGIEITDKHIEVMICQMLKKVVVLDGGDTTLLQGSKVDLAEFTKINKEVLIAKKRPAVVRPLLLGITKASLSTESFLSAASFQETTRVLTDAALKGKVDRLIGLKENVIIGKLIPAGTGISRYRDIEIVVADDDALLD